MIRTAYIGPLLILSSISPINWADIYEIVGHALSELEGESPHRVPSQMLLGPNQGIAGIRRQFYFSNREDLSAPVFDFNQGVESDLFLKQYQPQIDALRAHGYAVRLTYGITQRES